MRHERKGSDVSGRFGAVIFDMDGTLIEPLLDFAAIRTELGISPGEGIVEAIELMPPGVRESAARRLLEYELAAARRARLAPGAAEVIATARGAGMKTALLTRNHREAMRVVLERFGALRFDLAWSRQDGTSKPEPIGVLRACRKLGVRPHRAVCVGDFHYDIIAANAAGAVSVLLRRSPAGNGPASANEANYVIAHLRELTGILGI